MYLKTLLLTLLLCLVLAGCSEQMPETTPVPSETQTVPQTAVPSETSAPEETTVPTETVPPTTQPPEILRHPLTGQRREEPIPYRPVAVVINNISSAQPIHGIGSADLLFEHVVEGGGSVTRMLAVFTDLENTGTIGSIRSARTYLLDLARSVGAPLVHVGQSVHAQRDFDTYGYPHYNQFQYPTYFYRDKERLNAGYSKEHTMMIQGPDLLQGLLESGFDMTVPGEPYFGMRFSEEAAVPGTSAREITLRFYSSGGKTTTMTYDGGTDAYRGVQQWKGKQAPIADGNTGEPVLFRNVLILKAPTYTDGYHEFATLHGAGTGYFACGGAYVPIRWSRETTYEPFRLTLEDGTPVTFGLGKTYIGVIPEQSPEVIFS